MDGSDVKNEGTRKMNEPCKKCGEYHNNCYEFSELTDEEIMEVANEIFSKYKNWHHYQLDFARAILRKAQEK